MNVTPLSPTADHAEKAFAAARVCTGEPADNCGRAQLVALAGMSEVFQYYGAKKRMAELLGFSRPEQAANKVEKARMTANWWNERWVDDVCGALMAEHFGERAQ